MQGDLGKSQLSSLLETVPGLASVLRSPVADAIVNMVRAGAGLGEFDYNDAKELVQYASRRGLIPTEEGADLLDEVKSTAKKKGKAKSKGSKKATREKKEPKKQPVSKAKTSKKKSAKKTAKQTKSKQKSAKKTAKKATKKKKRSR